MDLSSLLLGHSDGTSLASGGLGVLSSDTESPVVSESTVKTDLLHSFEILTELVVDGGGEELSSLSVLDVLLSVKEPVWDLVLGWVLHDGDDLVEVFLSKLSGALVHVNVGLAAADEGETATNSLDGGEGVWNLAVTIDVGVEHTMNVLELLRNDQRHYTLKLG